MTGRSSRAASRSCAASGTHRRSVPVEAYAGLVPAMFALHEVAGGVWAAVAPSTSGPAVSNAAIVDLGDTTLVVDTFMTVAAATELASEALRLTGRMPHVVINTHWHSDHVRGNRVFDGASVVGTQRMVELIIEDAPRDVSEFRDRLDTVQSTAEALSASAQTPEQKAGAAGMRALAEALAEEADDYRLTLPSTLIGERLELDGERTAVVLGYGPGHTESDLFVHLPDDDLLIAGDLVWSGVHPKTNDGFPAVWAGVVDRLMTLDPRHVIAGHGPVGTDADIAAMAEYLREIERLIAAVRSGDVAAEDVQPPERFESWKDPGRFRAGITALTRD